MKLPVIRGVIDRRILVNYRVDPAVLEKLLPRPLSPKLVHDVGIAGICLIRLKAIRPPLVPAVLGIRSENAAHRIAAQLPNGADAVYIPRRDTSSRLNTFAGGRLFPGLHHRARFAVHEIDSAYTIEVTEPGGASILSIHARVARDLPTESVFGSIGEASAFFEAGSLGYSPSATEGSLEGLELRTKSWQVAPLEVSRVKSTFFEDAELFPNGSTEFDCALLMRDIHHEWHTRKPLYCGESRRAVQLTP